MDETLESIPNFLSLLRVDLLANQTAPRFSHDLHAFVVAFVRHRGSVLLSGENWPAKVSRRVARMG